MCRVPVRISKADHFRRGREFSQYGKPVRISKADHLAREGSKETGPHGNAGRSCFRKRTNSPTPPTTETSGPLLESGPLLPLLLGDHSFRKRTTYATSGPLFESGPLLPLFFKSGPLLPILPLQKLPVLFSKADHFSYSFSKADHFSHFRTSFRKRTSNYCNY
jgi:hypothetical protein